MPVYALTIFIGAFLLFQVQPLIGKYILPWFGGGPGVWATCLLFFQVLLLGGYAYAHVTARVLKPRQQGLVHLVLVIGALLLLPVIPSETWKPHGGEDPVGRILLLLLVCVGLPYFVLAGTGPLVQHWLAQTHPGRSPYRLYALSNLGSLLALASYPFYFESHFTRRVQSSFWSLGFFIYAACCLGCAWLIWRCSQLNAAAQEAQRAETDSSSNARAVPAKPGWNLLWIALPACATLLLLATTNKLCLDVASIPFLWIAPLGLYLLSFIICFDSPRWYRRTPFALALVISLAAMAWAIYEGPDWSVSKHLAVYCTGLFVCCMVCHGELYRLRPATERLTLYYLSISAGGALGGAAVALGAPLISKDYYELHLGLVLCGFLFILVCLLAKRTGDDKDPAGMKWLGLILPVLGVAGLIWWMGAATAKWTFVGRGWWVAFRIVIGVVAAAAMIAWIVIGRARNFRHWRLLACTWLVMGLATLSVVLWQSRNTDPDVVYRSRNFYCVLTVYEYHRNDPEQHHFLLQHGRITHGFQFTDPERAKWPTTYFGQESGIGVAMDLLPKSQRRIGVLGLGTGTLASYGRPGDQLRIYEINPEVRHLAQTRFSYLQNCGATVEVVLGDGRLSLEREAPQQFDLLALDAFSSDAVPVHLLTSEAFQLYDRHLKTNGIIAVQISNRYLELQPVVLEIAKRMHYHVALVDDEEKKNQWWCYASTWMLLTRDTKTAQSPLITAAATPIDPKLPKVRLWTDDFASLFQILR